MDLDSAVSSAHQALFEDGQEFSWPISACTLSLPIAGGAATFPATHEAEARCVALGMSVCHPRFAVSSKMHVGDSMLFT